MEQQTGQAVAQFDQEPARGVSTSGDGLGQLSQSRQTELAAIQQAAAVKARIEASFKLALARPRNEDQSRAKILHRCKDPRFAEAARYSRPVGGGKNAHGLSIRFAEEMVRLWGNAGIQVETLYEDETIRKVSVLVIDFETNVPYQQEILIQKTVERKNAQGREVLGERLNSRKERVFIVRATEDELFTKQSALVSKAIRQNALRLIPGDLKDEAEALVVRTQSAQDKQNPDEQKKRLIDAFAELGIMPAELEKFIGQPLGVTLQPRQLQGLRETYNGLKQGEFSWQELMQEKNQEPTDLSLDKAKAGDASEHTGPGELSNDGKKKPSRKKQPARNVKTG